ncbi:hypothetical protein LEP1GSC194_2325 [Leptospira alstonii serovar Sichuan str. 79601]|uniref:Uncharacterized protein n=1 Tax=Leptospira alstonii serovar Sichuan str. 79601 TaxID=1218565 RepID=M6CYE0_9LEPT|nr:hypothetical protein LEP1GSC194_2325 [Leptospira alstonii serovar Sichuan str. 79601]
MTLFFWKEIYKRIGYFTLLESGSSHNQSHKLRRILEEGSKTHTFQMSSD